MRGILQGLGRQATGLANKSNELDKRAGRLPANLSLQVLQNAKHFEVSTEIA
jgi:hypothetical protein